MVTAAQSEELSNTRVFQTSVISVDQRKAPFYLRLTALFIDYMLLLMLPIAMLVLSKFFGGGTGGAGISSSVWYLVLILWLIDFLALPLFSGQTFGKMLAGITMVKTDDSPVRLGNLLRRNILGYLLTVLTFGSGFVMALLNKSGRSLHDYIGGTVVVQGRRRRA